MKSAKNLFLLTLIISIKSLSAEPAFDDLCLPKGKRVYPVLGPDEQLPFYDDPTDAKTKNARFSIGPDNILCALDNEATVKGLVNAQSGQPQDVVFKRVKVVYSTKKSKTITQSTGWVDHHFISYDPVSDPYHKGDKAQERCTDDLALAKDKKSAAESILHGTIESVKDDLKKNKKILKPLVGHCFYQTPFKEEIEKNIDKWWGEDVPTPIYDRIILSQEDKVFPQVPSIRKEDGTLLTQQEMIDIDTLARTIYGEMDGCQRAGIQNFMAVAKVALNRADIVQYSKQLVSVSKPLISDNTADLSDDKKKQNKLLKDDYLHAQSKAFQFERDDKHHPLKSDLSRVLTASKQFQNWNLKLPKKNPKYDPKKKDGPNNRKHVLENNLTNIKRTLCPNQKSDGWNKALLVAAHAILYPRDFREKTKEIVQLHYTSTVDYYDSTEQVYPKIDGVGLVNIDKCVRLWDDKDVRPVALPDSHLVAQLNGFGVEPDKIPRKNPSPPAKGKTHPAEKNFIVAALSDLKFKEISDLFHSKTKK